MTNRFVLTCFSLLILGICLYHSSAFGKNPAEDARVIHGNVLRRLSNILPRQHVSSHPLDDRLAARWFDLFIDDLDSHRLYFTADDIRRFSRHRDKLVDHARRGNLSFADLVRDRYRRRLEQATKFQLRMLDEPHDFSRVEHFELKPDSHPMDLAELRERWRLRVKYDILVERSNGLDVKHAVVKLKARYHRVAQEKRFDDDEERYELFLDTFARSFGPHNRYFGERTLVKFRI